MPQTFDMEDKLKIIALILAFRKTSDANEKQLHMDKIANIGKQHIFDHFNQFTDAQLAHLLTLSQARKSKALPESRFNDARTCALL